MFNSKIIFSVAFVNKQTTIYLYDVKLKYLALRTAVVVILNYCEESETFVFAGNMLLINMHNPQQNPTMSYISLKYCDTI